MRERGFAVPSTHTEVCPLPLTSPISSNHNASLSSFFSAESSRLSLNLGQAAETQARLTQPPHTLLPCFSPSFSNSTTTHTFRTALTPFPYTLCCSSDPPFLFDLVNTLRLNLTSFSLLSLSPSLTHSLSNLPSLHLPPFLSFCVSHHGLCLEVCQDLVSLSLPLPLFPSSSVSFFLIRVLFSPISYLQYSQICARAVRSALKEQTRVIAQQRDAQTIKVAKWQNGKSGEFVSTILPFPFVS